jgi:ornithine carbamoyltransferase
MEAGALAGMHVAVATPPGYEPDPDVTAAAATMAHSRGGAVTTVSSPQSAVADAHAVYADVWVSMGDEQERAERLERLRAYQVDTDLMAEAAPDAVFMHCLPAHRGEEVTAQVIDGPQSVVFEQADNRLPTEQAAIHALIARDWSG